MDNMAYCGEAILNSMVGLHRFQLHLGNAFIMRNGIYPTFELCEDLFSNIRKSCSEKTISIPSTCRLHAHFRKFNGHRFQDRLVFKSDADTEGQDSRLVSQK